VPIIGDEVYIASGAKVLGAIKIGSNCVIGANAVVISSVADGCVVAGVPAKVIKRNIKMKDFR
jgi:Serine acetyltransferase